MKRRDILRVAAVGGGAAALPWFFWRGQQAFAGVPEFTRPLAIPPLLDGTIKDGKRVFDLRLQAGISEFFKGYQTPSIGINGAYLGPVLRARRGDTVRIHVNNRLDESSTLHWHGLRVPGLADGGPHQVVRPGQTWTPEFLIDQPASTQWYHSHAWHRTGEQVYRGLAGLFYLNDDTAEALDLPHEYGVDDIPVVLQDRVFNDDGSLRYRSGMHQRMAGMLGNVILVNGTPGAQLKARRRRLRLRILNGSNARIYHLAFSDRRRFHQIASDGGLLSQPVAMSSLRLAPGERAEVLVDIAPSDDVMLEHTPLELGSGRGMMMMRMSTGADAGPYPILRLSAKHQEAPARALPRSLVALPSANAEQASGEREFVLAMQMMRGTFINGRQMALNRIDHRVRQGDTEIWRFRNDSPMPHPMHIHGTQFRVLSRNGAPPEENERGYKDTVLVLPDETVRVLARFDQLADQGHPFMFHCHNLEHEDGGMMGQFTVERA